MEHDLKNWTDPFQAIWDGKKRAEYRKADRPYKVGDRLRLREYDPETDTYSGRIAYVDILHIAHGGEFGMPEAFCVLSISDPIRAKLVSAERTHTS